MSRVEHTAITADEAIFGVELGGDPCVGDLLPGPKFLSLFIVGGVVLLSYPQPAGCHGNLAGWNRE